MDLGLAGRCAWVTGASSGIGLATARALAAEGARTVISARTPTPLETAAGDIATAFEIECHPVVMDAADADSISTAASRVQDLLGGVDVLVVNAGGPPPGPFEAHDDASLAAAFELTTAFPWRLAKAVVPSMRSRGGGSIIFVTSWSTKEMIEGLLLSNMMRAAVVGMAKTLSKELGPDGIRTVCVAPGRIETPRLQELDEVTANRSGETIEEVRAQSHARIPLGRYGRPEEVGDVIAFLASPRASYLSGVTVLVDGGMLNGILS